MRSLLQLRSKEVGSINSWPSTAASAESCPWIGLVILGIFVNDQKRCLRRGAGDRKVDVKVEVTLELLMED